jgi:hypothetical protein
MSLPIVNETINRLLNSGIGGISASDDGILINHTFLDASGAMSQKQISFECSAFFNVQEQMVYYWEMTKDSSSGLTFGFESETTFQSGMNLHRKVKSIQYGIDGTAYEYSLDLGAVSGIMKETASAFGWKFKTVLKRDKAISSAESGFIPIAVPPVQIIQPQQNIQQDSAYQQQYYQPPASAPKSNKGVKWLVIGGIVLLVLIAVVAVVILAMMPKGNNHKVIKGDLSSSAFTASSSAVSSSNSNTLSYNADFNDNELPTFWNAVEWMTLNNASSKISINDGILNITDSETDKAPFLVSNPISVAKGDIVTISRKVKLHYANQFYMPSFRITELDESVLNLTRGQTRWDENLGTIVADIDYLYYNYQPDNKATSNGFVLYNVTDTGLTSPQVVPSVFDQWFTETLVYNTDTGKIDWNLNGTNYSAQGLPLTKKNISIIMHNYGWYTGHSMDIDYININVKKSE